MTEKWTNPIKGLVVSVISDFGIGKTEFALGCGYQPNEIIFVNNDSKLPPEFPNSKGYTPENRGYKQYVDLMGETKGLRLLEFHDYCLNLIDKLENTNGAIIWDTWTAMGKTCEPYVRKNPSKFIENGKYTGTLEIIGGKRWNDSWKYEGWLLNALKKKCQLLIITFHLKNRYVAKLPVEGKYDPGHTKAIAQYSDLRLWLTTTDHYSRVPIGLVMKNIAKHSLGERGIERTSVLPPRIPQCNWQSIWSYWDNPAGNRELMPDEIPNDDEAAMIGGYLTDEQKRMLMIGIQSDKQSKEKELLAINNQVTVIKEKLMSMSGSPVMKADQLQTMIEKGELVYSGGGITPEKVSGWL